MENAKLGFKNEMVRSQSVGAWFQNEVAWSQSEGAWAQSEGTWSEVRVSGLE